MSREDYEPHGNAAELGVVLLGFWTGGWQRALILFLAMYLYVVLVMLAGNWNKRYGRG